MVSHYLSAIESVQKAKLSYCKFITANDTGDTGGHQSGYHIHKNAWPIIFDSQGQKGTNKDKHVTINWQNEFETQSRFIYYGVGTRNEYRLTRFGRGFPFLDEEHIGDLLVLCKLHEDYYSAFVLHTENDIESFLAAFGLSPSETNCLIYKHPKESPESSLRSCFSNFIKTLKVPFPSTEELAKNARNCYLSSFGINESQIISNPDAELIQWIQAEYQLFKAIENDRYGVQIKSKFKSVEELIDFANSILNRRKSRAGKSLEHHLSEMFRMFRIQFDIQGITEDNKRPDFIFPNIKSYHSSSFHQDNLVFLASKTTCKDRWRQILNEADKIEVKHLFTLQQGISRNQLDEMYKYGVRLVVPKQYISTFPSTFRSRLLTLESFITFVKEKQLKTNKR